MAGCEKIDLESGEISAHSLKKTLMEKYGVDIDSDPTLATHFNNILNVFSFLPSQSHLPLDSCGIKPSRTGHGKDEITEIVHSSTLIINDGWNWKKYGSKFIKGSPYQRYYYRCGKGDCKAKKQVQQILQHSPNNLLYQTTHFNPHTCLRVQAANYSNDTNTTHASTSIVNSDTHDQPPLVASDHHHHHHHHDQESTIHNTIWNNDSWFDFTNPFNNPWLNSSLHINGMDDDHEE